MESICEIIFKVVDSIFLIGGFFVKYPLCVAILALFIYCLIITLDRIYDPWIPLEIWIDRLKTAKEKDSVHLKGKVPFCSSIKYIKWQKYFNGKYIDININKKKYAGSTNELPNPKLIIHDIYKDDETKYRLQVESTTFTAYSDDCCLTMLPNTDAENPRTELTLDKGTDYHVGENVIISADIKNNSDVLCLTWRKETPNGDKTLDITLPKYKGTKVIPDEAKLCINHCEETDMGTYYLLTACSNDTEIHSNKTQVIITKGFPRVSLKDVTDAVYGECVKIHATIWSFPKHSSVVWRKGMMDIDITQPKYSGSSCDGNKPVLCIKKLIKEDDDTYEIEVKNEKGTTSHRSKLNVIGDYPTVKLSLSFESQPLKNGNTVILEAKIVSSPFPEDVVWTHNKVEIRKVDESDKLNQKLTIRNVSSRHNGEYLVTVNNALGSAHDKLEIKIEENPLIFISGPNVIPESNKLKFKVIFPRNCVVSNATWVRQGTKCNKEEYTIIQSGNKPNCQTVEFSKAIEGEYFLSLNTTESNTIHVFLYDSEKFSTEEEGNCVRFYTLMGLSEKTLQRKLNSHSKPFQTIWDNFMNNPKVKKGIIRVPAGQKPKSPDDLDITMLYAICREELNLKPPANGWGSKPGANDTNTADDIERIRFYRNKISHNSSLQMDTNDFNDSVLDLLGAIRRLSGDDDEVTRQCSKILNKVFFKGDELRQIISDLKKFQKEEEERNLSRFEEIPEETKTDNEESQSIRFHKKYHSSITMFESTTIAYRRWKDGAGLFFMEKALRKDENIFIYLETKDPDLYQIGILDRNPDEINLTDECKSIESSLRSLNVRSHYACITLQEGPCLLVSWCDSDHSECIWPAKQISTNESLWLAFSIRQTCKFVQISQTKKSVPEYYLHKSFYFVPNIHHQDENEPWFII